MNRATSRVVTLVLVIAASFVRAQDPGPDESPLRVRFLKREPAKFPQPARVRLRIELVNRHEEPRWILTTLSTEARLPADDRFVADPEEGFPFFGLKTAAANGEVTMLGFVGTPRFWAFRLPAKARVTLEDFDLPSSEDLTELDWAEASSLKASGTSGEQKEAFLLPLETWMKRSLASSDGARIPANAMWTDIFRDRESGELLPGVPKDTVTGLKVAVARRGRAKVAGFEPAARYYVPASLDQSAHGSPWRLERRFDPVRPLKVEHLAFAPDQSWLAVSLQAYKVLGIDLKAGREKVFPQTEETRARFFAFSPRGHLLVKQPAEGELTVVWDWTANKEVDLLRSATKTTLGGNDHVAAPGGGQVMVSYGRSLQLRDFARFETRAKFERATEASPFTYRCGCFSSDGKRFAAGYEHDTLGGRVYVWNLPGEKEPAREVALEPVAVFHNRQAGFHFLALSEDGKILAGAGKQGTAVWVWDVDQKKDVATHFEPSFRLYHGLALTPDGATLAVASSPFASGGAPDRLVVRGVRSGTSVTLEGLRQPVHAMTFSADGRSFAAGDHLGAVRVWRRD